jgi:hypothetical protein
MTLISANTLAFGIIGKERFVLREYEFGIWKRGRAIGIWGIHVSNTRNNVLSIQPFLLNV